MPRVHAPAAQRLPALCLPVVRLARARMLPPWRRPPWPGQGQGRAGQVRSRRAHTARRRSRSRGGGARPAAVGPPGNMQQEPWSHFVLNEAVAVLVGLLHTAEAARDNYFLRQGFFDSSWWLVGFPFLRVL